MTYVSRGTRSLKVKSVSKSAISLSSYFFGAGGSPFDGSKVGTSFQRLSSSSKSHLIERWLLLHSHFSIMCLFDQHLYATSANSPFT